MLRKDRVLLRNVVIAVVCGSVGAVAIGTSCLGRDRGAPDTTASSSNYGTEPPVSQTQTTQANAAGGVEPVGTTNITSTTIIVNPASSAAPASTDTSTSSSSSEAPPPPPAQPVVIQAAPQSAPPANQSAQPAQSSQPAPAPSSSVDQPSPESVQAQDQRDQQEEQMSFQGGTTIIPVPIGGGGGVSRTGAQGPSPVVPNYPGSTLPPVQPYVGGAANPGPIGPYAPNGGAGNISIDGNYPVPRRITR